MWSRLARTVRNGTRMSLEVHRVAADDELVGDHPVPGTSMSVVSRAAAPGKGTWSSDQPVMAWYEATYSSFQSRSHSVT